MRKKGKYNPKEEIDCILGIRYCYFALHRILFKQPNPNCTKEIKGIPICCRDCKLEHCSCRCNDVFPCKYSCVPGKDYPISKDLAEFDDWLRRKNEQSEEDMN